jgi:hypothetical protein
LLAIALPVQWDRMGVRAALFAACLAGVTVAAVLGGSWSDRLSDHRGFYLVPVRDAVAPPARAALAAQLPRRGVLVVVGGLGCEETRAMPALATLRARGQCLRTYVGAFSVSQPVYGVLSTGLEQDRTGARNNEPPASQLRAESIWSVARQAGLSVSAISELSWWQRLFPGDPGGADAFSTYVTRPRSDNYFTQVPPADLMLIHPLYVDEAGHQGGAASAGYRQAVARADREIAGLITTLDLTRDLLVVTADHGHTLRGGHGGEQPRVTHVLTCYAGPGVRRSTELGEMHSTSVAPSLALLLGLRFPAHMRAGLRGSEADDDLDVLWRLTDAAAFPAEYMADRRQAVARFREENRDRLLRWSGGESSWSGFYEQHRQAQRRRELLALAVALALLGLLARYPVRPGRPAGAGPIVRDALLCVAWVLAIYLALYLLTVALRGSFDATAVNQKGPFICFGLELSAAVLTGAGLLHLWLRRSLAVLRADALTLIVVTLTLSLGHPAVFGWHLGFPIPPSEFIYFPYFAALFLFTLCFLALPLCLDWPRYLAQGAAHSARPEARASRDP